MDIPKEFVPVLLAQIALFLGLWIALKRLWFAPALAVIAAREKRSQGSIDEARAVRAEAERLRMEHGAAIEEAKAEAQREVQDLLRQAEAVQRQLIGEATEDAQRTATEMRERVDHEIATARLALQSDVQGIANEIARTVLGRAV